MTIFEQKAALRLLAQRRIDGLPSGHLAAAGRAMAALVTALPAYERAETVLAFASTVREPDTRPLLERVLRDGKVLALPACVGPGVMVCRQAGDLEALLPGPYGIREPGPDCPEIPPGRIGLAVVPCLAMDGAGNRLGRGGGYYDRFLAAYDGPALALCIRALLFEHIPAESWDRPVPMIVTESAVLRTFD